MLSLRSLRVASTLASLMVVAGAAAGQQPWKLGVVLFDSPRGGARIGQIFAGSPAQAIGLQPGYTILAVDGKLCRGALDVRDKIWGPNNPAVDRIFWDGSDFWKVTANLGIVANPPNGKQMFQAQQLKKTKVADPRIKK